MGTTATVKLGVDLLSQATVYAVNCVLQLAFRVEHHRVSGGRYMIENADEIEKALRIWLREMTLEKVTLELYSPLTETAYEECVVTLSYEADPQKTEVTRPPVAQLEELLSKLEKLPSDAAFRFVVTVAPGATEVEGWCPTALRPLAGGVKAEHQVGSGPYGYGQIGGTIVYRESNWKDAGGAGSGPDGR
jgi:hypothetical protein